MGERERELVFGRGLGVWGDGKGSSGEDRCKTGGTECDRLARAWAAGMSMGRKWGRHDGARVRSEVQATHPIHRVRPHFELVKEGTKGVVGRRLSPWRP